MVEDTITTIPAKHRMKAELLGWMLGVSLQNCIVTCMQQCACVAVQCGSRKATSSTAAAGDPGSHPLAPIAILQSKRSPWLSTPSKWHSKCSPEGSQQLLKRRERDLQGLSSKQEPSTTSVMSEGALEHG